MSLDRTKIFPRLKETSSREVGSQEVSPALNLDIVNREFLPNIGIFYLCDIGDSYMYLDRDALLKFGLSEQALHDLALENLERELRDCIQVSEIDSGLSMLHGSGNHESTAVLLPDFLRSCGWTDRDVISIPTRDVCLWGNMDDEAVVSVVIAAAERVLAECKPAQRVSPQLLVYDPSADVRFRYRLPLVRDVAKQAGQPSRWWHGWKTWGRA